MTSPAFTIGRERLFEALAKVGRTIKGDTGSDILACVLISANAREQFVSLTTTRIETTTQHFEVEGVAVHYDVTIAATHGALSDLVDKMTGDTVTFEPDDSEGWWNLHYDVPGMTRRGKVRIATMDADRYPSVLIHTLAPVVLFDAESFKNYLNQVSVMVSKVSYGVGLDSMCIKLGAEPDFVTLYGADNTHGLARVYLPITEVYDGFQGAAEFVIPQRSVGVLKSANFSGTVTMLASPNGSQLGFRSGPTTITTSLVHEKYPPVEQIIREESSNVVEVDAGMLQNVADIASTIYGSETKAIAISAKEGVLNVRSYKTERGEFEQDLPAEVIGGGDAFIQVNPKYLIDSLKSLGVQRVRLGIETHSHALVIRSPDKPNCLHLIFPMHATGGYVAR